MWRVDFKRLRFDDRTTYGFTPQALKTSDNSIFYWKGNTSHPRLEEWRKLVGHCFAAPPDVEHTRQAVAGF